MTTPTQNSIPSTPFRSMRLPLPAFTLRLPRLERTGLSRTELRDLVAEMLG